MSGRVLLELRGVAAGYGAIQALAAVDLEVAAGPIVTLIGANGAGKGIALGFVSVDHVEKLLLLHGIHS